MSARKFLDTNIFVRSFDLAQGPKQKVATRIIREALASGEGVVSYQVVQAFFHVALHKFKKPLDDRQCAAYLDTVFVPLLAVHSSIQMFERALELMPKLGAPWYDSLIVAAAVEAGCSILYSEDLQHGRRVGGLEIRNPFIAAKA